MTELLPKSMRLEGRGQADFKAALPWTDAGGHHGGSAKSWGTGQCRNKVISAAYHEKALEVRKFDCVLGYDYS